MVALSLSVAFSYLTYLVIESIIAEKILIVLISFPIFLLLLKNAIDKDAKTPKNRSELRKTFTYLITMGIIIEVVIGILLLF